MSDYTSAEDRARVARDNAFRDLAAVMNQMLGPVVAICKVDMPQGGHVVVPTSPGQMSELIAQMYHTLKQLEISVNTALDMLMETRPPSESPTVTISLHLNREEFWLRAAAAAERNTTVLRRAVLSQGAAQQPGILVRQ
jgi:hypothetical protein